MLMLTFHSVRATPSTSSELTTTTNDTIWTNTARRFLASSIPPQSWVPRSRLIVPNAEKNIMQLQFQSLRASTPHRDESSMVVHIDGACRNNGSSNARAAYGIFFGRNSPYNTWGLVPPRIRQTSSRAEIEALAHALPIIEWICANDLGLMDIIIATDSRYLVKAMSQWMEEWIENGGRKADGTTVAHFDRLKALHDELDEMEYGDHLGVRVQFWHVPREMNREADALANLALDS